MAYLAIMAWDGAARIIKLQDFDLQEDAEDHVAAHQAAYPAAFVCLMPAGFRCGIYKVNAGLNAVEVDQAAVDAEAAAAVAAAAEAARLQAIKDDPLGAALVVQLKTATAAQISTYVDNNVTDLASARLMLKRVILVLARIARQFNGS